MKEKVIGKWKNIGHINNTYSLSLDDICGKNEEFNDLYFLPNSEPYWIFEGWTNDILYIHHGGNEPILSYKYELKEIDSKEYLFLRLESITEVFININHNEYNKDTLGNHDNIDLPFIIDENVVGKWKSVGFVKEIEDFDLSKEYDDLYLDSIEFIKDGTMIQSYMDDEWNDKWTKDYVINLHRNTVAKYIIKDMNNDRYLFLEWKMGNYIYGGLKPEYYVFKYMI